MAVLHYLDRCCQQGARLVSEVHRQGAAVTRCSRRDSSWTQFFSTRAVCAHAGCPERLWNLHLGGFQNLTAQGPQQTDLMTENLSNQKYSMIY